MTKNMRGRALEDYLQLAQNGMSFQERKKNVIWRKIAWCNARIELINQKMKGSVDYSKRKLSYDDMWVRAFRVLDEVIV